MATATESQAQSIERGYRSLSSLFRPQAVNKKCHRCQTQVYHAEKVGPVNEVVFHKNCFKCSVCGNFLNLKNFWSNQTNSADREIYCYTHAPRVGGTSLDPGAMGIRAAVDAQKGYQKMSKKLRPEVREAGTLRIPKIGMQALELKRATNVPSTHNSPLDHTGGQFGADAINIKGPVDAQLLVKGYEKNRDGRHHYPPNIYKKKQKLIDAQKQLEEEHRREEDRLLEQIAENRRQEVRRLSDELNKEWQLRLRDLTEKFEREMDKKKKKMRDSERKQMTIHFENQKKDLEVVLQEKKHKKKESMTLRLKEKDQRMTATMVSRQSKQMLDMLAVKQEELKQEVKEELHETGQLNGDADEKTEELVEVLEALEVTTTELPPPHPPGCRKKDIYTDVNVFDALDDQVIKVAESEQLTYTELIQQLTDNLTTDLEKVRSIYRWITVKDLNVMEFAETFDAKDNPLGLLRGIKYGTETYHVLFMRLCSYAGLHCVEIKGHSKSVGYEPGMKILPETFQNTWNAVLIEGDWRLVQCNWGARHLVLNKDKKKDKIKTKAKDQIRYQYDEHYFLTDPDEFIQEFWAKDPEWQLLENPITLEEFEALPFVRSVFFHFGMRFEHGMTSVIQASEKGGYDIKLKVPESLENDLVFYYQLRFADKERKLEAQYRGANLERYVFQTMIDNSVMFSIHLPTTGEFFFEIFANKIDEHNRFGASEESNSSISPFRLKCACKFKIVCNELTGKMHPLPDCASGEWGPLKGKRHFGIRRPTVKLHGKAQLPELRDSTDVKDSSTSDNVSDSGSSESGLGDTPDNPRAGIINVEEGVDLLFKIPRPLHFVAKLKMSSYESKVLDPFVQTTVEDDTLQIKVTPPMVGQFGLDVYARPKEAGESATLSHAFKYLLNVMKVTNGVDLPQSLPKSMSRKDKWGSTPLFDELGLKTISHKDPKITVTSSNQITIEMHVPSNVQISHQFLKEPDEDKNELVTMVKDDKDQQKAKFFINIPIPGNYMLSLFARNRESEERSVPNVFNYLIVYKKTSKDSNGSAKLEEKEKKQSSIFRKSLFKKDK